MCCLTFEHECYKALGAELPALNAVIETARGTGKVTKLNILARQVEVTIPDLPAPVWFSHEELTGVVSCAAAQAACGMPCASQNSDDELDFPQLEALYEEDVQTIESDTATPVQDEPSAGKRRRPRRHRKRPAAPAHDGQAAPPPPARAAAPAMDSTPQSTGAPRRRRTRPHKPRAPQTEPSSAPVRIPVPTDAGAVATGGKPATPSARYHPRKRR